MKKNRKGFTITELVIVIVVIAILAAVLIPTFAGLVKKANQSADIQAVRQMNVALAAESAVEKPANFQAVIGILEAAGYDAEGSLKPITKDHKFYWYSTYNTIILVNEGEGVTEPVVFPTDNDELIANFSADVVKTGAEQLLFDLEIGFRQFVQVEVQSPDDVVTALNKGQSITLTEDVELTQPISVPAGSNATIDLNGNTLTTADAGSGKHSYAVQNSGTVTVTNGTFTARGIMNYSNSKLIVKDAVVNAIDSDGGGCIRNKAGGEVIIDGGTFTAVPQVDIANGGGVCCVYNDGGTVTINSGTFIAKGDAYAVTNTGGGTMTINGGDFTAYRGALACTSGTITVNNGTFKVTHDSNSGWIAYADGTGKIVLNGGSFSTVTDRKFTGNVENNLQ